MWEETLVFTVHMPEIALVRFLVWDHDPIGRDFIGQRTLAFSSMLPGGQGPRLGGSRPTAPPAALMHAGAPPPWLRAPGQGGLSWHCWGAVVPDGGVL